MRFSAVQEEDGFGVGLGQENLASDVDDRMMAATGEILPDSKDMVDDPSTTYNLPLLFANGYPTSLDKISLTELECFITFMIQCSSDPLSTGPISPPQWWPKEVQFSNPFVRPKKINDNWMGNLKKLVFRCYTYHRSEYLLRFCSYLAQYPREKLYYVNNWDSTTSLYHKGTGKLLATFRNENMEYDKIVDSPRRSLLPQNHATSRSSSKANKTKDKKRQQEGESSLVVIQPRLEEIYLCDNCDAEFGDLEQMKDHEKVCSEPVQTISSRSSTPYEPIIQPELNQDQFLDYFKLSTIDGIPKPSAQKELSTLPSPTIICEPVRSTRRIRAAVNFTRCPTIPFSSPAGIIMAKKSKSMTENTQQERLDRLERHLTAPPLNKFSRPKWLDRLVEYNRWVVTYKPNREKSVQDDYVHKYTFGAFKRKPVLTLKAQLLYVACGTAYVRLERLSPEKLEDLMQNPWKYRPPIPRKPRPKIRPGPLSKMKQSQSSIIATKRRNTIHIDTTCPIEQKRRASLLRNRLQRPHNSLQNTSNNHTATSSKKTIVFVDLCSSDEDEDIVPIQTDENRDPMSLTDGSARTSPLKNGTINQTNCRSRSLGYPTTSLTDWLRDGVINKDKDKCTNKYIGGVIDKTKTYSSVLKSSP